MNKFMTTSQASGQSIADRVIAAKHSIAGSGLAKSVCKATTEEVLGPKKKHLDYLLACTNEPNVSIPQLANLLIERTQHPNWVVVYKALVTIHNLMNYGNERFTQYLASNNCTFQLATFLDKTGVQGYDMSTYIRRYAKYLNEKSLSYRNMAFDFCKVKRGKDDGLLRTMTTEKLLKTLPGLQQQLDALLEFDVTPNELTNGVINACFMLLFKDLIRLFACYNDGIINLLEKYFEMPKKQCRDALDIYKRFLVRMDRVSEFLKVAESVGIDKGDIPDLAKAPSSLLEALEEHLKSLESSKKGRDKPASVAVAVNSFAAASQSAANVSQNANMSSAAGSVISEEEKRKIIEEEQKELEKMKEMASKEKGAGSPGAPPHSAASTNPFLASSSPAHVTPAPDLFGAATDSQPRPSNDLLALSGPSPFGDNMIPAQAQQQQQQHQQPLQNNPFGGGAPQAAAWGSPATTMGPPTTAPSHNAASWTSQQFASDAEFARAFGTAPTANGHTGGGMMGGPAKAPPEEEHLDPFGSPSKGGQAPTGGRASADLFDTGAFGEGAVGGSPSPVPVPGGLDLTLTSSPAQPSQRAPSPSLAGFAGLDMSKTSAPLRATSPCLSQPMDITSIAQVSSPVKGFDGFGEILKPQSSGMPQQHHQQQQPMTMMGNGSAPGQRPQQPQQRVITGDLDSSLASLAGNLSMNPGASVKKTDYQWTAGPDKKALTGGNTWQQPPIAPATNYNSAPQPQMRYGQPYYPGGGMMPPSGGFPQQGMPQMGMNPGMGGMAPMGQQGQPAMWGGQQPMAQQQAPFGASRPPQQQHNDPFGSL